MAEQKKETKPDPGELESLRAAETTKLDPLEEALFKSWGVANHLPDIDQPDAHYDYRGFYKASQGAVHPPGSVEHFPDTFKQHGHPTFSIESMYSRGPWDGGMWMGDTYLPHMSSDPAAELSETQKDPIRAYIDLLDQKNKTLGHENKKYELHNPKPVAPAKSGGSGQ